MLINITFYFLGLLCLVQAQCPAGSTNQYNGHIFRYCYRYLGTTKDYTKAVDACRRLNYPLIMPKTDAGLDDLYKLYKAYSNFYFWIGASATPANPFQFYFQDGRPVFPNHFCKGNPKGSNNLCGFYTTTVGVGNDKCMSTGPCKASFFDHGIICQTTF